MPMRQAALRTAEPGGAAMLATCVHAVAAAGAGGGAEGQAAAARCGLRLLCSEWDLEGDDRRSLWRLYRTDPPSLEHSTAARETGGAPPAAGGLEPTLIVAFCSDGDAPTAAAAGSEHTARSGRCRCASAARRPSPDTGSLPAPATVGRAQGQSGARWRRPPFGCSSRLRLGRG